MDSSNEISDTSSMTTSRLGGGEVVDIEVSVISGRSVTSPHKLKRKPLFTVELIMDKETKVTNAVQSEGDVILWNSSLMLTATISSNLIVRVYCKHRRLRDDHIVAEATFEALNLERNKDIEIELYDPSSSARNRTAPAYVTLRLKVALSVTFNIGRDTEMDFRSSTCLKQMERIVGSISSDKFKQLSPAWIRLFSSLDTFSSLAQKVAELDSRAQVAVGAMASAIKVLVDQIKRDERIDDLGRIMCELYEYVVDACSVRKIVSFEKTLQRLLAQTAECAYFITDYQRISVFAQRAVVNMISNADTMITNFEAAFGELKIALILGSSLQTTLVSYRILQTVERIENLIRIDRLPILENVGWDSGKICLRGTRETTIKSIVQWASQRHGATSDSRIYLLSGPITCGKSTIAHSIAKVFHEQNRLGAAVFLHNEVPEANSRRISSSIVHQLAGYDSTFHACIAAKIKADQSLVWADIERQFRTLVVDTIASPESKLLMIGPILIIIDNLHLANDEERHKVLTTIAEHSDSLPPSFRFLFTCRSNDLVAQRILGRLGRTHVLNDDDADNSNSVSISQHISQSLTDVFARLPNLSEQYEIHELQGQLERRARGMHFWVSTIYRSILACEDNDVFLLFTLLLSSTPPLSNNEAMDQLYLALFKVFFRLELGAQHLFDVMIQSRRPIPLSHLRRIACIPWESAKQGAVVDIAKKLGLIVPIDQDEQGVSLFGVHPSLEDFLTNPRRCQGTGVYVDREVPLDQSAAEVCIHIMNQSLRYNICSLEDVMIMNVEIKDKERRIEQHIPKSLRYACCNWTLHLEGADLELNDTLRHKLQTFLSSHILHWIEVMSLLGHFDDIDQGLFRFLRWLQLRDVRTSDVLYVFTTDTIRFVRSFSAIISKAGLQTYISALPLMPAESMLLQQSSAGIVPGRSTSTFNIKSSWNVETQSLGNTSCCCSCGTLVALGSSKGGVSFLDARTQTGIDCNIKIEKVIQSMAFSPDGQTLATVTNDGQVSVHTVKTGARVHSSETNISYPFITYSNDGATILVVDYYSGASHTSDCYLWDTLTGHLRFSKTLAIQDLTGIALSPDGRQLAVPNEDGVQLIDMDTKGLTNVVAKHSRKLDSKEIKKCIVAWSPDAAFLVIASASEAVVRLWSLRNGKCWTADIGDTRDSTSSHVLSFSLDSSRLVYVRSYRDDKDNTVFKIHILDTGTGMKLGEEQIDEGKIVPQSRHISILPEGQEMVILSNVYSREGAAGWKTLMYLLSDATPAYMANPPISRNFKPLPTVIYSFTTGRPSNGYASTVDAEGWVVNSKGERLILVPFPNFDISSSIYPPPTPASLDIRHPESKKMVLRYFLNWGERS